MDAALLTENEAAKFLRISPFTLQGWRHKGGGPRFVRIGRNIRYALLDLERFVLDHTCESTSDWRPPLAL